MTESELGDFIKITDGIAYALSHMLEDAEVHWPGTTASEFYKELSLLTRYREMRATIHA